MERASRAQQAEEVLGAVAPAALLGQAGPSPFAADYAPSGVFGSADSLIGRGTPEGADGRDDTWPGTTRLKEWLSGRPGRVLAGRHILIVDDDIRNVFALTHVLGRVGITGRTPTRSRSSRTGPTG